MKQRRNFRDAQTAGLVLGLYACAGMHPAAAAEEQVTLEEVVVTASHREESVLEVPYNISAYSGDALARSATTDLSSLARTVPGISYIDQGSRPGANNNGLIIRGLRSTQLASANDQPDRIEPSVSTYVGETPVFFYLKLLDLDRVEVLRGPQGTLYGSGAVGGTVRYIPKKPDPAEGFTYQLNSSASHTEAASDPSYEGNIIVNVPLRDNMALRGYAGYQRDSGFIDDTAVAVLDAQGVPVLADPDDFLGSPVLTTTKKDINESHTAFARASLWWGISDRVSATLSYHYQDIESSGRQVDNPDGPNTGRNEISLPYTEPQKNTINLVSLDLAVDLGAAQFTSSSAYYAVDTDLFADATNFYSTVLSGNYMGYPRIVAYRGAADGNSGFGTFDQNTFVQELRLVSTSGGLLDWTVGAYYQRRTTDFDLSDKMPGFADWADAVIGMPLGAQGLPQFREQIARTFEDTAVFGELTWRVTPKARLTAGGRAFWQKTNGTQTIASPSAAAITSTLESGVANPDLFTQSFPLDDDVSDQIFKLSAAYDVSDAAMAYVTWAQGFRRGGVNGIDIARGADPRLLRFRPDTADNWEIGLKGRIGGAATYTVAAYLIDWKDFQFEGTEPVGGNLFVGNGRQARSTGLEAEINGRIGPRTTFGLGYTYTDAQVAKDFQTIPGNPASTVFDGDPLPGTPKHMVTAVADYTWPLASAAELVFHVNGSYRSDTVNAFRPTEFNYGRIDSFSLWDAAVTYRRDSWSAALFVDNLTNTPGSTTGLFVPYFPPELATRQVARPRTVGIRVTFSGM